LISIAKFHTANVPCFGKGPTLGDGAEHFGICIHFTILLRHLEVEVFENFQKSFTGLVDARCGDGRRFIVDSDELLSAFLELEATLL
jgi:hypothetical protein